MEKEKKLVNLLSYKEIPELSKEFDDRIMSGVHKIAQSNSLKRSYLRLAWIFFFLGLFAGIFISLSLTGSQEDLTLNPFFDRRLIIQVFCSVAVLLLFEKLYRLTAEIRMKRVQ